MVLVPERAALSQARLLTNVRTLVNRESGAGALTFDGGNDYVVVTNNPTLNGLDKTMSVSLWVKTTSTALSSHLINKDTGFIMYPGWIVWFNSSGSLGYQFTDGASYASASYGKINTGNWTHAAITRNSGTVCVYIDSVLKSTDNITNVNAAGTINMYFGVDQAIEFDYAGTIDDVLIYAKTLSQAEITQIYGGGHPSGMIGWWKFDETSGTLAEDSGGYGFNGIVNGATWTAGTITNPRLLPAAR